MTAPNRRIRGRFTSAMRVKKEEDGTFTLLRPLVYYSALLDATIRVPKGFNTDFASVPRLPFVFLLTGDTAHEAAVIHDYLYRSDDGTKHSRKIADDVFTEAMAASGIPGWRRNLMWLGVRAFGNNSYKVTVPVEAPAKSEPEQPLGD